MLDCNKNIKYMKILLVNDDGIYAPGLWALAGRLKEIADVVVAAPDREQSGIGAAITLHHPLRLQKVRSEISGIKSYAVGGTPGDSVIMAMNLLTADRFDLVLSGINNGPNLGVDIFQSGTVGGALQAYLHGLSGIAVSINEIDSAYLDVAARITALLAGRMNSESQGLRYLLNVNIPGLALGQIKGVKATRFLTAGLADTVEEGNDGRRSYYWLKYNKTDNNKISKITDVWAVSQGYVSITPLHKLLFGQSFPVINGHFTGLLRELV